MDRDKLRTVVTDPMQSVILSALFILLGAMMLMIGVIADLIATNRKLIEKLDWRLQHLQSHMRALGSKV